MAASKFADRVASIHATRFNYHKVLFSNRFNEEDTADFKITGPAGMIMSALSNLVDNAIFWSRERRAKERENFKPAVMVAPDMIHFDGPAIIVADNGRGFQMDEDEMILPFRSLKPNGMGVGLYYTSLVMEIVGGKLLFPPVDSIDIPKVYDGACVALVFQTLIRRIDMLETNNNIIIVDDQERDLHYLSNVFCEYGIGCRTFCMMSLRLLMIH